MMDLVKNRGYDSGHKTEPNNIPARKRYSRFLYEVSLDDFDIKKIGLFSDYQRKVNWCNYVCFDGHQVYFYSSVLGSKGCTVEK